MGAFYGSIHVRSLELEVVQSAASGVMRKLRQRCYVGPEINGWIGVYTQDHGQDAKPAEMLAKVLKNDIIQLMVHDDDVFICNYWRNHREMICFTSSPGYFDEDSFDQEMEEYPGNAAQFRHLLGTRTNALNKLLKRQTREGDGPFDFESERLEKWAKLFKIDNASTAFEYLSEGETAEIKQWSKFTLLPAKGRKGKK